MPHIDFPFDLNGMFVDVMIAPGADALAALVGAGEPLPMPRWGRALIDTGTNVTGISLRILGGFGLLPLDMVMTHGIGGEMEVGSYEVSLTIADRSGGSPVEYAPPDVTVIGIDIPDIDALLGLDLLIGCRMMLDGPGRRFSLHF